MFQDRTDAGRQLAELVSSRLSHPSRSPGGDGTLVLGLPRGGVPVAAVVAQALGARLDVLVVRKIGLPWQPELALGAVGENGAVALNADVVRAGGVGQEQLDELIRRTAQEVEEVAAQLRDGAGPPDVIGRAVIVVDDGVATGATARAAADVLRGMAAGPVILATPVAALSSADRLRSCFDEVICVSTPVSFGSVGQHYEQFEQVSVARVRQLLAGSPS